MVAFDYGVCLALASQSTVTIADYEMGQRMSDFTVKWCTMCEPYGFALQHRVEVLEGALKTANEVERRFGETNNSKNEGLPGWTIPVSPLVGTEAGPGLIGLPAVEIYRAPALNAPPSIARSTADAASTQQQSEFEEGRIIWTTDGLPLDAYKPAALGECIVLGCHNRSAEPSVCCIERHRHAPSDGTR